MAITINPDFPAPDRSRRPVSRVKDEDGVIDIGWCEGVLGDGRPFRAEMWAQDQISMLTVFFSAAALEGLEPGGFAAFVEAEGLVRFASGEPAHCEARQYRDGAGNPMWSVNIVVGVEDETYLSDSIPVYRYRPDATNTHFARSYCGRGISKNASGRTAT